MAGGTRVSPADNPQLSEYRRREQSITLSPLETTGEDSHDELLTLDFGPHHAAGRGRARHQTDRRLCPYRHREDRRGQGLLEGNPGGRADGLPVLLLH